MSKMKNTHWQNIKTGLQKYERTMERFWQVDISNDEEFQRTFNGFYRVRRRKPDFYRALYNFLESHKNKQITFAEVLQYLYERFGRLEASFSSKVVATINPNMPIWDSEVLKRLKIKTPAYALSSTERFKQTIEKYNQIILWYRNFMSSAEARDMIETFDKEIGITNTTPTKKIDFILWQTRN